MNNKLIKLLASVCIGLGLIIAGEWSYASFMRHRLLASISSAKQQDYKIDELPEIELTKQTEADYADLVARPLFIKGRRAVDEPSPETEQAAAQSAGFDWQLTGIYSADKTVSALFSRSKSKPAKDNHRKITIDGDLDGWKLIEINKDRVMFKQGNNEKELLLRKPKSKALPDGTRSLIPTTPIPAPVPVPTAMTPTPVPAPAAIPEPAADTTEDTSEDE